MTPEEFAAAVRQRAFEPAVSGVLTHLAGGASGRGHHPRADALTQWFNELPTQDRAMVTEVIRDAAHAVVFHVLCILDGVAVIDDEHSELVLTASRFGAVPSILASPQSAIELHDEFNALIHPPSEPWPPDAGAH